MRGRAVHFRSKVCRVMARVGVAVGVAVILSGHHPEVGVLSLFVTPEVNFALKKIRGRKGAFINDVTQF